MAKKTDDRDDIENDGTIDWRQVMGVMQLEAARLLNLEENTKLNYKGLMSHSHDS
jgi:hypothetical protein